MEKIKTLFLSIRPIMFIAIQTFFMCDPIISANFDNYDNYKRARNHYDVVIFDDGSLLHEKQSIIPELLLSNVEQKKVLLTSFIEKDYIRSFIKFGINGIVTAECDIENLKYAIIKIANGEKYFCNSIKRIIQSDEINNDNLCKLTKRQGEILYYHFHGYKNKQIAEKLFISVKTIENHKENIKKKLGLESLFQLKDVL